MKNPGQTSGRWLDYLAQDGSLSAQAEPRPRDGPAGPNLRATVTVAGPAPRLATTDNVSFVYVYTPLSYMVSHPMMSEGP